MDTHFPPDNDAKVNEGGELEAGCKALAPVFALANPRFADESWNFHFTADCLSEVARCTLAAEPPSYQTILDLDRKIRDFPIPGEGAGAGARKPKSTGESMQRFVMSHSKEVSEYNRG